MVSAIELTPQARGPAGHQIGTRWGSGAPRIGPPGVAATPPTGRNAGPACDPPSSGARGRPTPRLGDVPVTRLTHQVAEPFPSGDEHPGDMNSPPDRDGMIT